MWESRAVDRVDCYCGGGGGESEKGSFFPTCSISARRVSKATCPNPKATRSSMLSTSRVAIVDSPRCRLSSMRFITQSDNVASSVSRRARPRRPRGNRSVLARLPLLRPCPPCVPCAPCAPCGPLCPLCPLSPSPVCTIDLPERERERVVFCFIGHFSPKSNDRATSRDAP